jgi:bacteriorhodopsin
MATIVLAIVSVLQAFAATRTTNETKKLSNIIGSVIGMIAFVHYIYMVGSDDEMSIRYSDWLFTLPLLLFEIMLVFGIDIVEHLPFCILSLMFLFGMLGAGWMAIKNPCHSTSWLIFGFFCLIAVYGIVLCILPHTSERGLLSSATLIFFLMWTLYGAVALTQCNRGSDLRAQYAYDVLDMVAKALFGLFVAVEVIFK